MNLSAFYFLRGRVNSMVEIPGNDISIRKKVAQQKVASDQKVKSAVQQSKTTQQLSGKAGATEQIMLSSAAKNIQQAQKTVKAAPEIRTEKVDRIKKEIAEGRFKVDSDVLAKKILEDIIRESDFLK